jgi:hypothetical protein
MVPFLGREMAEARIAGLLEEAEGASRARAAGARSRGRRPRGLRGALGRRLVALGSRLIGAPVEVR